MLIVISDEIIDLIENDPSENIIGAIEKISSSYRMGNHIFFGSRSVLEVLRNCKELSTPARNTFNKMFSKSAIMGSYLDVMSLCIQIIGKGELSLTKNGKLNIIKIPILMIEETSILEKTILLSENTDDNKIYFKIAQYYIYHSRIGSINIKFENRGGGGSTLGETFINIKEEKERLCLCLVDSDKKSPKSSFGDTAGKLLPEIKKEDNYISMCKIISEIREIENLIPIRMYQNIVSFDTNTNRDKTITLLINFEEKNHINGILFFDIKEGLCLHTININPQKPESSAWDEILKDLNLPTSCSNEPMCRKRKECRCILVEGLGSNILRRAISILEDMDVSEIQLPDYLAVEWNKLGKLVTDWCCGTIVTRT